MAATDSDATLDHARDEAITMPMYDIRVDDNSAVLHGAHDVFHPHGKIETVRVSSMGTKLAEAGPYAGPAVHTPWLIQ